MTESSNVQPAHRVDFQKITIGMDRQQVASVLGPPLASYPSGTHPSVYGVQGYFCPQRISVGDVYVYVNGEAVCYIFFDPSGNVSAVDIGGS